MSTLGNVMQCRVYTGARAEANLTRLDDQDGGYSQSSSFSAAE